MPESPLVTGAGQLLAANVRNLTTSNPLVSQIKGFAAHRDGLRARGRASQKCSKKVDLRLRNGLPRVRDLRRRETPAVAVLASGCQAS